MLSFLIVACSVLGSFSQVIEFVANPGNIAENAGTVQFQVMASPAVSGANGVVVLEVLGTATAATGHDFGGSGTYTVTIVDGGTMGTLTIAIEDDTLMEPAETIELELTSASGGGATLTGSTMLSATATITADVDTDKVRVDFTESFYVTDESSAVTVGFEFTDPNGQPTVLNGADMLNLALPAVNSLDTAVAGAGMDYTDPTGAPVTLTFDESSTSQTLAITINDDGGSESTEVFYLSLASITTGTYVELGTTRPLAQVHIRDNDVESLICVAKPEVFRRSQADFEFYAFTSLSADRDSIGWSKSNFGTGALANVGTNGKKLTVPRPGKRSARRFGYYTFTATGSSGASLSCNTYLRSRSEILNYPGEIAKKYTLVIYPATLGGTDLSPRVTFGIDYDQPNKRNKIKWEKDGKVMRSQTRPTMRVTTIDAAGVYTISRSNRGKAWFAIIELIASDCPTDQYLDTTCMACPKCYNGGICDAAFEGRCICPPCFEGNQCELVARDVGGFGQTTRFTCAGDLGSSTTCKGLLFTFQGIFGSCCACGWSGSDCETECSQGTFGADCAQTCHCMTVANCDKRTGVCSDGICETGYGGENCQIGP